MDLINTLKMFIQGPAFFKTALKEKRDVPRLTIQIKSHGLIENKNFLFKIIDLSLKGVQVECATRIQKNIIFPLTVQPSKFLSSSDFKVKTLMVQVAWCRKKRNANVYQAGLTFQDTHKIIEDSWVYYLFNKFGEKSADYLQKRINVRVPTEIYIICTDAKDRIKQGIIHNISMGGVLVKCRKQIPVAETLQLVIGPYQKFKTISLRGRVLRASYFEETDHWIIAIEFVDMNPKDQKNIGKLIIYILQEIEKKKNEES